MDTLTKEMMDYAGSLQDEMVARRRDLHHHPEPGWTEFRTASIVATELKSLGYDVIMGVDAINKSSMMGVPSEEKLKKEQQRAISEGADPALVEKMTGGLTGVVGVMHFAGEGPTVGLRFDMDSNDVTETDDPQHRPNKEGFASCHDGAMHACGHDGHTTVGLAVAKILAHFKDQLKGTVKLCFQPAEEGVRGAKAMVDSGVVDDVDYMLGAHFGFKMKETGSIACNVTGFLATGKYDARFTGRASHAGAAPEAGRNAVFTFKVELFSDQKDDNGHDVPLADAYPYYVIDAATGNKVEGSDGTVSTGGTVSCKGGQRVIIAGIPVGSTYRVTEQSTAGFHQSASANTIAGISPPVST